MGQTATRSYMCCSVRDKYGAGGPGLLPGSAPQFDSLEVDLSIERAQFAAFAPLHQRTEVPLARRIALASDNEVHVYRLPDTELSVTDPSPQFPICNKLVLAKGQVVTGLLFCDDDTSRQLAVAFGPEDGVGPSRVRIWSCEAAKSQAADGEADTAPIMSWKQNEGFLAELDDQTTRVSRLAASRTYLLTADDDGECRVWQKNRSFHRRASSTIHPGGVADLSADRLFAYSAGLEDRRLCVWALPDLSPVLSLAVDIPQDLLPQLALPPLDATGVPVTAMMTPAPAPLESSAHAPVLSSRPRNGKDSARGSALSGDNPDTAPGRIGQLTLLRRPLSRWAGWQGSSRGPKAPRGVVFLAGVLSDTCEVCPGAGVLMEWSLGETPTCNSAQVAHPVPIVSMAYGPYDNGPLVTADARGVFRVWEILLDRGLRFSQQIELLSAPKGDIAVCVEQPRGLYVSAGDKRLYVWQRFSETNIPRN
eukprot:TRINITY_DN14866_c0_g1_i1.p1 TRINITY_DN14866_c0_g1~~TRINITY_DN14866_c0_g1_i1.p1  ORF type:complete len:478 (-),score=63.99 TRINITY_DN14866_c0_g1_i1:184-1617(-)